MPVTVNMPCALTVRMRPLRIDVDRRTELSAKPLRSPAESAELASLISRADGYPFKLAQGVNLDVPDEVGEHPLVAKFVVSDRVAIALANARRAEEEARIAREEAENAAMPGAGVKPEPETAAPAADTERRVPRRRGESPDAA